MFISYFHVYRPLTPPYVPFGIRQFLFWVPFVYESFGTSQSVGLKAGQRIFWGCRMRKVICLPVHRYTFYLSQMPVSSFTDAHLYVYRCRAVKLPQACGKATAAVRQSYHRPVVDVKVFIEKRNGLGSRLIMTKLGTLRSQFMKTSVYKGEIFHLCRETILIP